ncbi:MAG TPA: HAD-IIIA family hydrolase [Jiangellaceae bacterium]|nr:HAD-IIIA family hydrolase [Jiangellaceae bacterium]
MTPPRYAIVVPTVGRPSLARLLGALAEQDTDGGRCAPVEVVVVDDRPDARPPLNPGAVPWRQRVVASGGRGPAAARNLGWQLASAEWIAFLDDDVVPPAGWARRLVDDLLCCGADVAGSQGRIQVPLPADARPTDWQRNTAGLQDAAWATADMAYRRAALVQVLGFDERFHRAYREDADLALRVRQAGWRLVRGSRHVLHPVRPAGFWVSVRAQAGNGDDALMRRLHGADWRRDADVPRGRLGRHAITVAAAAWGLSALLAGHRRTAASALLGWTALTGEFAWRRLAPGPRPGEQGWAIESGRMLTTSVVIPAAAVIHRLRGAWRHRGAEPWPPTINAVLFDRDGTLVHDVPYNGDPSRVRPVDGAGEAVAALRDAGVKVGVLTNQSGIGRGLLTPDQVSAVNERVDAAVGPFDTWQVCPHGIDDGCDCRKPKPGMVVRAARALDVPVEQCLVVGDIGADVQAARAAGARAVLVPTPETRADEVANAPVVAPDLAGAVDLVLAGRVRGPGLGERP